MLPAVGAVGDVVAAAVMERYGRLGKKGKCGDKEWTVLAAFVAVHDAVKKPLVLAMATGTKCLPREQVAPHLLSDSHAEVLARRALCHRLLEGSSPDLCHGVSFWREEDGGWNDSIRLYLYTSKEPCGSSRVTIDEEQQNKRVRLDVGTTVRKPGRGSATDCVSCADKISKWLAVGLLSKRSAVSPLVSGIVVGGSFDSRATFEELLKVRQCPEVALFATSVPFVHDEREGAHPSGLSLNWIQGDSEAEVTQPNGKKMGATSGGDFVNPKQVSRLAPMHRDAIVADYEERKAEWKKRTGF